MGFNSANIITFSQIDKADLELVGKKAYQLAELRYLGIPISDGFVILPFSDLSESLIKEVHNAYKKISGLFKESSLNIFTSPLKGKFFQFLDIKGDANLILKIKEIWASHIDKPVAIIVQKNINSKIKGKVITNELLITEKFLTDKQVNQLTQFAKRVQKHFYFPKDIDYVIERGKIYVTQIKPFTGIVKKNSETVILHNKTHKILLKGNSINPGIATGVAKVINLSHKNFQIKKEDIIIVPKLNIKFYRKIKEAKAIVANEILPKVHDKIIYRKYITAPTITGAENATRILQNGNIITVNGATGEIYSGGLI